MILPNYPNLLEHITAKHVYVFFCLIMLSTIKFIQFHAEREKNFWLFTENIISHRRDLGIYCPATVYVSLKQLEVTERS